MFCQQNALDSVDQLTSNLQQLTLHQDSMQSVATSIVSHPTFQQCVADTTVDTERRIRMVLVEGKLRSWGRAEMAIKLIDQDLPQVRRMMILLSLSLSVFFF